MMNASSDAVNTPADGPYSRTELKRNVSETEMWAGIDGSLTVAEPLTSVSRASISHCVLGAGRSISTTACAIAQPPAKITTQTYSRPRNDIHRPG